MLNSKLFRFNNLIKKINNNSCYSNNNNKKYIVRSFCNINDKDKDKDEFNLDSFVNKIEKEIETKNELNSGSNRNSSSSGSSSGNNSDNSNGSKDIMEAELVEKKLVDEKKVETKKRAGRPKGSKSKSKSINEIKPSTSSSSSSSSTSTLNKSTSKLNQKPSFPAAVNSLIKDFPFIEPYIKEIIHQNNLNNKDNSNSNSKFTQQPPTTTTNTTISITELDNVINQMFKKPQQPIQQSIKNNLNEDEILGEDNLLPKEIVNKLDEYIIGQAEAKRSVSIALRNRWRRKRLEQSIKSDVYPKNILMIGPTGVGKTEIARRLASIVNAPFIKVEATKYTEVGYHGPDVDTIIKDLIDVSISNIKSKIAESHKASIESDVEKEIISSIVGPNGSSEELVKLYRNKSLDHIIIDIEVPSSFDKPNSSSIQLDEESPFIRLLVPSGNLDKNSKKRKVTVAEAKSIFEKIYRDKYTVSQDVTKLAIQSAEQNGIVFLDEIDKICTPRETFKNGGDASSDGVQRDLLPIIEGCSVNTKYGMVDTSRILFIASGAFHTSKPSDLISELQGRLPIRVELKPLDENDFYRILTEPKNNQIKQQQALMKTEEIELQFTEEALREVAKIAFEANAQVQNLGARRLHGIIERIIEELSFNCDLHKGKTVIVGVDDVKKHLSDLLFKTDLSKYII